MKLLYIIVKFIVFPGSYMRGFWEHLTCRILSLPVEPVGYVRLDEASGHVEHSLPKTQFASYLMAVGPGFMNFNMGLIFFLYGFINTYYMGATVYDSAVLYVIYIICMYIGASMLNCVFPLTEDILNYWSIAYGGAADYRRNGAEKTRDLVGKILGFPIALIARVGAFLEKNCVIFILWIAFAVWMIFFR